MEQASKASPHIAMVSSPGAGHLNPLISFSKLLRKHDASISITLVTHFDYQYPILNTLPSYITSLSLPPISLSDLPPETRIETRIATLMARSVPFLKTVLQNLKSSTNLVAFITDLFGNESVPIAKEVGVPHHMLYTSNLFMLSFMFHLPALDETTSCEYRDLPDPIRLPGYGPLRGEDFISPLQDRKNKVYRSILRVAKSKYAIIRCFSLYPYRYRELDGILVNSFDFMEHDAAKIFAAGSAEEGLPPVHLIGPVGEFGSTGRRSECMDWLNRMPHASVLYISFGSGGTLSSKQTKELALGLIESKQRFLWVTRAPNDSNSGAYFGSENKDPSEYLPKEFFDTVKDVGMVVQDWASQVDVLGHGAVGGFMTHCGWNSVLESVMNGVPMIAWPLYAEQGMNSVLMVDEVKIALRAQKDDDGLIGKNEICRVVKELMEGGGGKRVKIKVDEVRMEGVKAMEEGGSSYEALAKVVNYWQK